ncbi:MAG: RNA pyrophosphohydrolase [Litorivicinus sp.]
MLDGDGFRLNVGMVLMNARGQVFWGQRPRNAGSQFPQGGVDEGESAEQAMYRELREETGLNPDDVKVLGRTQDWVRYHLPRRFRRKPPGCVGQKQKWFLLELISDDSAIHFDTGTKAEFAGFEWVSWWYPVGQVVPFKRDVYRRVLSEMLPIRDAALGHVVD